MPTIDPREIRKNLVGTKSKFVSGETVLANSQLANEMADDETEGDTIQPPVRPVQSDNG